MPEGGGSCESRDGVPAWLFSASLLARPRTYCRVKNERLEAYPWFRISRGVTQYYDTPHTRANSSRPCKRKIACRKAFIIIA